MASNQPGPSSAQASASREYIVRVPKGVRKKCSVLKFNPSNKVDFATCGAAKLERENNLREYKLSHDIDMMPKFGAGSEYGREQKDEARRKKYGIIQKHYNPDDQPWLLKLGGGKQARKFKGSKEGGVLENASYYVFTQCADGAFEALPLHEWYNFMPSVKYKYLNADEAEQEYEKRDRTLNYFSVMLQKRLKNEDVDEADEEEKTKKKKKSKDFKLTDMDDWAELSEGEEESEEEEKEASDSEKPKKKEPKDKNQKKKKPKKKRRNVDDEASEDSDDLDEGKEVDYMTDSDSDDEDMFNNQTREKTDKYEEKGVEDEEGLRKVIESGDEEEEEENKEEEDKDEDETDRPKRQGKKEPPKKGAESDSESSDSGSESDPEKDTNLSSALFMQKKDKPRSRSATPTITADGTDKNGKKRKSGDRDSPLPKKAKTDSRTSTPTPSAAPLSGGDNVVEEAVRRYLTRKPMTIKDLLQKLTKSTGVSKETLAKSLTAVLKKINPDKITIQDKLHLHIKKTG